MLKFISSLVLLIFVAPGTFAGGVDVAGGGFGVERGNLILLQDLVEAGVETHTVPTYTQGSKFSEPLVPLNWLDLPTRTYLADRLSFLSDAADPTLAAAAFETILFYKWSFPETPLTPTQVPDPKTLDQFIQLALRQRNTIYINQKAWDRMPAAHRAGLILHEVLAGLLLQNRPASRVRQLVGALFSNYVNLPDAIIQDVQSSWPSQTSFAREVKRKYSLLPTLGGPIVVSDTTHPWRANLFPSVTISGDEQFFKVRDTEPLLRYVCESWNLSKTAVFQYYSMVPELLPDDESNQPRIRMRLEKKWHSSIRLQSKGKPCGTAQSRKLELIRRWVMPEAARP